MATTTLTAWIVEIGMRVTFHADGVARTLTGFAPDFDPSAVTYVTSRAVTHLAARDGTFRITGSTCSPNRLANLIAKADRGIDGAMTLDEVLAHPFLGKTAPALMTIMAAYADEEQAAA